MTRLPLNVSTEPRDWYRVNAAAEGTSADVYIYDVIGGWFWGVDAATFVRDLNDLDVETINLFVNSPGGSVYDAVAIMNALRRHKAKVVAVVDGLAASAASFIIQAADEVVMGVGTELMIHDAWSGVYGNAEDLRREADSLDRLSNTIASIYAERAGGTEAEWREVMQAETWYSADEAVAAGLADRVERRTKDDPADDGATNKFDLSIFAHAGRKEAPAPHLATTHTRRPSLSLDTVANLAATASLKPPTPSAERTNTTPKEGADTMSDDLIKGLREQLGVPAEANLDEPGLLAALAEALAEQEPTPAPAAAAGTVNLDEAQYQDLVAAAADGRAARQQQLADQRAALVDAAIGDGRIAPARRDNWLNALAADSGAADTLAGLAPGLMVNVKASGYTGGVDEAKDEDDTVYSRLYPTATNTTKEA